MVINQSPEDKVRLENFGKECQEAVESTKLTYKTNMGSRLNNPNTHQNLIGKLSMR